MRILSAVKFYWVTHGTVCGLKNIHHRAHGVHSRRWIRALPFRRTRLPVRASGIEILGAGEEIRAASMRIGFAQHTASRRQAAALWPRDFRYDQRLGSRPRSLLQDGEAGVRRSPPRWRRRRQRGVKRTLAGLEMTERGIARDGYRVWDDGGREIGYVTSVITSAIFKKNIALAYVPPDSARCRHGGERLRFAGWVWRRRLCPRRFISDPKRA